MANRYLVTGCAGFIASRVSELLLDAGYAVVGVDNLNDAYDVRLKHWRLARLEHRADFCFHHLDVTDRVGLAELFRRDAGPQRCAGPRASPPPSVADPRQAQSVDQRPYEAVVNLAARAGVRPSVDNPWVYYDANCQGTLNLLEMCRQHGVPKFVLASTSSLYGAHNPLPYREDADTNRPLSPYAASKKAAETLAYTYHYLHGIDVSVPRYFTVYGPAGRPDMSIFRFIRRIAEGEPIVLFGDGRQSRDFTYVDDIARGTVAALRPLGYEAINLGGDRPIELALVIEKIGELLGRKPQIEYRAAHPADVSATWADIGKARRLLSWSPQVSLEEGLARSVAWYRENRSSILPLELGDR